MRKLLERFLLSVLIVLFMAVPAGAFDLRVGHLQFGPSPADMNSQPHRDDAAFGAMLTMPLNFSTVKPAKATLNGQDISYFTKQDAKDSAIVIMLFGVAIAAGALTVNAAAN